MKMILNQIAVFLTFLVCLSYNESSAQYNPAYGAFYVNPQFAPVTTPQHGHVVVRFSQGQNPQPPRQAESQLQQQLRPQIVSSAPILEYFSKSVFNRLAPRYVQFNFAFSPIGLNTILAMLYVGSYYTTADELQTALRLPTSPGDVLNIFRTYSRRQNQALNDFRLVVANKMFYKFDLMPNQSVLRELQDSFNAETQRVDFRQADVTANHMNAWVKNKTLGLIPEIVSPDSLYGTTDAVLMNCVYLRARWLYEFSERDTNPGDFFSGGGAQPYRVPMMFVEERFLFGKLPELNAYAIELPFKDSDIKMLLIMPESENGLAFTENQLIKDDILGIPSRLESAKVALRMPRFQFEFNADMVNILQELNIRRIFSTQSELAKFFINGTSAVSKIQQKFFVRLNEGGLEAAAVTFSKIVPLSHPTESIKFTVDRPFVFIIRDPSVIYFMGHVVRP